MNFMKSLCQTEQNVEKRLDSDCLLIDLLTQKFWVNFDSMGLRQSPAEKQKITSESIKRFIFSTDQGLVRAPRTGKGELGDLKWWYICDLIDSDWKSDEGSPVIIYTDF